MYIEELIIMVIHVEIPQLIQTRKKFSLNKQNYYGKNCLMKVGKR